jgi:hypothetical protein
VIIAVPEQHTTVGSGIGIPEHTCVLTWYRWWCSACRVSAVNAWSSHASGALEQAEHHLRTVQCHAEGQLTLFPQLLTDTSPKASGVDRD